MSISARRFLCLALAALAAPALALPHAAAAAPSPLLPDLVADPIENPVIEEQTNIGTADAPDRRRLLRFNGYVHDLAGAGPFQMTGSGPSALTMGAVTQDIERSDGTWISRDAMAAGARMTYESADGHNHWHLAHIARYSLVTADHANLVAPSMKVGFCTLDNENIGVPWDTWHYSTECEKGNTAAAQVEMGVSPGWRDIYKWFMWFQWVDVSNVMPGRYALRSEIDPDGYVLEADEQNAPAYVPVVISGYDAVPATQAVDGPTQLVLGADPSVAAGATLAPPRFRIDTLPAHGTLSDASGTPISAGTWLADPYVTYTPGSSSGDVDEFSYSTREATGPAATEVSPYPISPRQAKVTLEIAATAPPLPAATVAISGAHDLVAGTAMQLTAAVEHASAAGLSWSATAGTIGDDGVYHAPSVVPGGGPMAVTVQARLSGGASDSVTFRVTPVPVPRAAPTVADPATLLPATPSSILPPRHPGGRGAPPATPGFAPAPQLRLRAAVARGKVSAAVVSRFNGRARVVLLRGRTRVSHCAMPVRARRSYVCQLPVVGRAAGLRVTATLRRQDRRVISRTAKVRAHAPD